MSPNVCVHVGYSGGSGSTTTSTVYTANGGGSCTLSLLRSLSLALIHSLSLSLSHSFASLSLTQSSHLRFRRQISTGRARLYSLFACIDNGGSGGFTYADYVYGNGAVWITWSQYPLSSLSCCFFVCVYICCVCTYVVCVCVGGCVAVCVGGSAGGWVDVCACSALFVWGCAQWADLSYCFMLSRVLMIAATPSPTPYPTPYPTPFPSGTLCRSLCSLSILSFSPSRTRRTTRAHFCIPCTHSHPIKRGPSEASK